MKSAEVLQCTLTLFIKTNQFIHLNIQIESKHLFRGDEEAFQVVTHLLFMICHDLKRNLAHQINYVLVVSLFLKLEGGAQNPT